MTSFVDLSGLHKLMDRVEKVKNLDATPLMATWMKIITEDNRKGVLAGTDKDGSPMKPVTYRPKIKPVKPTAKQKNNPKKGARVGAFAGFGAHPAGLNNNLTTKEYQKLGGPPLAPRGAFSRVITNLQTTYVRESPTLWYAIGAWFDVVSTKGVAFLGAHFNGRGVGRGVGHRLPIRDLRGVRPEGREKARKAAVAWMTDQVRFMATGQANQSTP